MKAMGACLVQGERPEPLPRLGTVTVEQPNRRWATDFTTVWTKEDGMVAVVPVIDCGCRSMLAIGVTKAQDAAAILAPVRVAMVAAFDSPAGVPDGFEMRTDHGPQYTGETCAEFSKDWKVNHTFAPVGRPTGNAVAERVIRTMKEECIWLRDWVSLKEFVDSQDVGAP
jgi:putative transposase